MYFVAFVFSLELFFALVLHLFARVVCLSLLFFRSLLHFVYIRREAYYAPAHAVVVIVIVVAVLLHCCIVCCNVASLASVLVRFVLTATSTFFLCCSVVLDRAAVLADVAVVAAVTDVVAGFAVFWFICCHCC